HGFVVAGEGDPACGGFSVGPPHPQGVTVGAQGLVGRLQQGGDAGFGRGFPVVRVVDAPVEVQVPARDEFGDAFHEPGRVAAANLQARLPGDDVLQHPGRIERVTTGGGRVLVGRELVHRGFLVAGVDKQQELPGEGFGSCVLVDLHVRVDAVGEVVVRV